MRMACVRSDARRLAAWLTVVVFIAFIPGQLYQCISKVERAGRPQCISSCVLACRAGCAAGVSNADPMHTRWCLVCGPADA